VWVPDAAHEALRDLVCTREAARQDQQRAFDVWEIPAARRLPPAGGRQKHWTNKHLDWIKPQVRFDQPAFLDYVHEVERAADRLQRLEKAIDEVLATAPVEIQEVVRALQALRGVGQLVAVSVVAELGRCPASAIHGS